MCSKPQIPARMNTHPRFGPSKSQIKLSSGALQELLRVFGEAARCFPSQSFGMEGQHPLARRHRANIPGVSEGFGLTGIEREGLHSDGVCLLRRFSNGSLPAPGRMR